MGKWIAKQFEIKENIQNIETEIEQLLQKRHAIPYKISIEQMSPDNRYVKLHQESKYLMNIIKMICYQAETALANLLANNYSRSDDEIRALVKAITGQPADLTHIAGFPQKKKKNCPKISKFQVILVVKSR